MVKLKNCFQRREKKYKLSYEKYDQLVGKMKHYMQEDEYGLHTIISVYFDTDDYEMIRHSINKPVFKEKFRLRSYGVPIEDTNVFMEIKKKVKGVVYKRRVTLPYNQAREFFETRKNGFNFNSSKDMQIKQEIDWLVLRKKLEPKVMIAYDRRAFLYPQDEDFRVTFDFNIRYRTEKLDIAAGAEGERVAPEIDVLMEVKALGAYPLWFSEILGELQIYPASFSKYAQTYQRYLFTKEEFSHVV
ncbi:polyphosphate polymerase domain-containing protein [Enterococcus sp. BWR-S5]|uniref:polyphosphate polymerase domain-containing protein n=1 Tax=Enterococcus sp. BWR-S5 TaxID=2787714 RepID=UPI00192503C2|nr:polyphosphate polymerase domain-containing protein [Enterococcus sp. BWR-S5]MBL1224662.1 polyphosphate polymerase domain-containing protein [Enterococcus sp. BWR-S5]